MQFVLEFTRPVVSINTGRLLLLFLGGFCFWHLRALLGFLGSWCLEYFLLCSSCCLNVKSSPQHQNSPKALYNRVFGPKSLKI